MASERTPDRLKRPASVHDFEKPNIDLKIIQTQNGDDNMQTSNTARAAHLQSKKKRTKTNMSEDSELKQDDKFYVELLPKKSPKYTSYTNHMVFKELHQSLSAKQYAEFSKTIFGKYLGMQRLVVQPQIFRCFMSRELKASTKNAFSFDINGFEMTFTINDFELVSGLTCHGHEAPFKRNQNLHSRLMDQYFGGSDKFVKKSELCKLFNDKKWGPNDDDALNIAILYFIHTYILSDERSLVTVPKDHFILVESGKYKQFPWGKLAFNKLIDCIHHKMDHKKQYFQLHGFPLAMQVWLYERCSSVPSTLAVRNGSNLPRLLNWKTTHDKPFYKHLMRGIFRKDHSQNCLKWNVIVPTVRELEWLNSQLSLPKSPENSPLKKTLAVVAFGKRDRSQMNAPSDCGCNLNGETHASMDIQNAEIPIRQKRGKEVQTETEPTPETTVPVNQTFASNDNDGIQKLRDDLIQFKHEVLDRFKDVKSLINDMFELVFSLIKGNKHFDKGPDVDTRDHPDADEVAPDSVGPAISPQLSRRGVKIMNLSKTSIGDSYPLESPEMICNEFSAAGSSSQLKNSCASGDLDSRQLQTVEQELLDNICVYGVRISECDANLKTLHLDESNIEIEMSNLGVGIDSCPGLGYDKDLVVQMIQGKADSAASVLLRSAKTENILDDILGVVVLLGQVETHKLSCMVSSFLGEDQMLALVCKSHASARALEKCRMDGEDSPLDILADKLGIFINAPYSVICLEDLRPYKGVSADFQRELTLPLPALSNGKTPQGFMGYAVNKIVLPAEHLQLRSTLFYCLLGKLQVYESRQHLYIARSCIQDGAVSLDGGIIRGNGVVTVGYGQPNIVFPVICQLTLNRVEKVKVLEEKKRALGEAIKKMSSKRDKYKRRLSKRVEYKRKLNQLRLEDMGVSS